MSESDTVEREVKLGNKDGAAHSAAALGKCKQAGPGPLQIFSPRQIGQIWWSRASRQTIDIDGHGCALACNDMRIAPDARRGPPRCPSRSCREGPVTVAIWAMAPSSSQTRIDSETLLFEECYAGILKRLTFLHAPNLKKSPGVMTSAWRGDFSSARLIWLSVSRSIARQRMRLLQFVDLLIGAAMTSTFAGSRRCSGTHKR